jgi:hypothetical protein
MLEGFAGASLPGLLEINDNNYVLFGDTSFTADSKTGCILISDTTPINTYNMLLINLADNNSLCVYLNINVIEKPKPLTQPLTQPQPQPLSQPLTQPQPQPLPQPLSKSLTQPLPQPQHKPRSNPFAMSYVKYNSPSTYIPVGVSVLPEGKPVNPMGAQNLQAKVGRT